MTDDPISAARRSAVVVTTAAALAVLALAVATPGGVTRRSPSAVTGGHARLLLSASPSCGALLDGLRTHTAHTLTELGGTEGSSTTITDAGLTPAPVQRLSGSAAAGGSAATPAHSTTNNQEAGADEPDIVKSDGRRIVSIVGGVLRIVDTATHAMTGSLDLGGYAGADRAQLLVSGDRALVTLPSETVYTELPAPATTTVPAATSLPAATSVPSGTRSTYLLVGLGAHPTVLSSLRVDGDYVDARLIGGRVRLVVHSAPRLRFRAPASESSVIRTAVAQAQVRAAPLSDWLPSYSVSTAKSTGGAVSTHRVDCAAVQHPARYSGTSLVTIYTIDPAAGFVRLQPRTLAADDAQLYATTSSLYLTSFGYGTHENGTSEVHRFALSGSAAPTYVGSGTVPGIVKDSYSLSAYRGHLRVVTTNDRTGSSTLSVLDDTTLEQTGVVTGLGRGQRVYAVRFQGVYGYVVTFRSVDPLYVLDLRDPKHPATAGELHLTGYSSYLHPVGDGRLLGIGQDVRGNVVRAMQVQLFDVATPSAPTRLDRVTLPGTPGESQFDPHSFVFWPQTGTAVVPVQTWQGTRDGELLVLHVSRDHLRTIGTIPATDGPFERSLVVGDELWALAEGGFAVRDLHTLAARARIEFS